MGTDTSNNPNDARADRAVRAIALPPSAPDGFEDRIVRLLADLQHLCDRQQIEFADCVAQADRLHAVEESEHGPADNARFSGAGAEPIEVIVLSTRGISRYRADADDILGESINADENILLGLWELLVQALETGDASEGEIPQRTFFVDQHDRPALAAQLIAVRDEALNRGIGAEGLSEPDAGLASYLT